MRALHVSRASRAIAAHASFQPQRLGNGVAAIFGGDFGPLISWKARSALIAAEIMMVRDHLGPVSISAAAENTFSGAILRFPTSPRLRLYPVGGGDAGVCGTPSRG